MSFSSKALCIFSTGAKILEKNEKIKIYDFGVIFLVQSVKKHLDARSDYFWAVRIEFIRPKIDETLNQKLLVIY
jgi:hypothetical protein